MVYGGRPKPRHGKRSSHVSQNKSFEIPSFSENITGKKFDRRNYSNPYLIKAESRMRRDPHCGRGPVDPGFKVSLRWYGAEQECHLRYCFRHLTMVQITRSVANGPNAALERER
ncbi:hypothetical protein TNCV_3147421 [Trichonephila clavipes]|nr:hypothetical protein TNCV_3147421 [Trichonephila clavipes]